MVDLELGPSSPHLHLRAELSQIYIALLIFFRQKDAVFLFLVNRCREINCEARKNLPE